MIQGGISSDPVVQDVVERSRRETVDRLAEAFGMVHLTDMQRVALRGWVGFLEWSSLEWLTTKTITKTELADLISRSAEALPSLID